MIFCFPYLKYQIVYKHTPHGLGVYPQAAAGWPYDEKDIIDVLRFLREVVHFQRFGEAQRGVQDKLAEKKYYMKDNNC